MRERMTAKETGGTGRRVLAVDLGSSVLEFRLVDENINNSSYSSSRLENPTRLYGAEVLSRLNNAVRLGLSGRMQAMMRDALVSAVEEGGTPWRSLSHVALAGNTAMQHLFFGLETSGLLAHPFTPQSLAALSTEIGGVPVHSFPCISAFVGGDIVAGIYDLDLVHASRPSLFVDLGTNGEIILSIPPAFRNPALISEDLPEDPHLNTLLSASVAAGPAFEGGNISKGMPALSGAIDSLSIRKGFCRIHAVGDTLPPKGICGSGLIEAVYELYTDGIVDRHGSFVSERHRQEGFPLYARTIREQLLLTQKDIRSLQVAKAAICAGMWSLVSYAGLREEDIADLFLAGSFGTNLNLKKASGIGLIPEAFLSRTTLVGNTSLNGAVKLAAAGPKAIDEPVRITSRAHPVSLADSPLFREEYLKQMDLP